jgi:hypothetical protein
LLGKAETGADDILHRLTNLVKPYLLPPPESILVTRLRTLQTNRHAGRTGQSSGFLNCSPDLSRLLTHAMKAPRFVKLTFCAEFFASRKNKSEYHFETEGDSHARERSIHFGKTVNARSGVWGAVAPHLWLTRR